MPCPEQSQQPTCIEHLLYIKHRHQAHFRNGKTEAWGVTVISRVVTRGRAGTRMEAVCLQRPGSSPLCYSASRWALSLENVCSLNTRRAGQVCSRLCLRRRCHNKVFGQKLRRDLSQTVLTFLCGELRLVPFPHMRGRQEGVPVPQAPMASPLPSLHQQLPAYPSLPMAPHSVALNE